MDQNGHGTHVAGTIGAVGDNGIGVTGVAWDVQLMGLRFLDTGGNGNTSDAIELINYMTDMKLNHGVNIVVSNNSWGGGAYSASLQDAIAASVDAGILFVASAGNDSRNTDIYTTYPQGYDVDGILSVASTDRYDNLSYFSNYGVNTVDLAAPGSDVYSTLPGGGYGYKSGTSMAAPHVSGAAALLMAANPGVTPQQIKSVLMDTADPIISLSTRVASGGRLNLHSALSTLGVNLRQHHTFTAMLEQGQTLDLSASRHDAAPLAVSNALDLVIEIYDSEGTLLASVDPSDAQSADLSYTAAQAGEVTIEIRTAPGTEGLYSLSYHIKPLATLVDAHLFYNGSVFDAGDAALNAADDLAVAQDKSPTSYGSGRVLRSHLQLQPRAQRPHDRSGPPHRHAPTRRLHVLRGHQRRSVRIHSGSSA
jgi:serine protease